MSNITDPVKPQTEGTQPLQSWRRSANRVTFRLLLSVLIAGLLVVGALAYLVHRNLTIGGIVDPGGVAFLTTPPGFKVNVFASGFNQPRFMAFGPDGVLYVADRANNRIVALPDANGDGVADTVVEFATDVPTPHSLAYWKGAWYVGVPTGVIELKDTNGDGRADERKVLIDTYPDSGHSTRTVLFLPDGRMLVSVGSSCNVCLETDRRRASVLVYQGPDPKTEAVFASGLRNAVGLAINPVTGEVWATNNGRDLMGDDLPPETVNVLQPGDNFGWPHCHAGDIVDPDYGSPNACQGVTPPILKMQAHSAPLGLAFYTGTMFPAEYRGDLFMAFHGSWNRSVPTGYKVVRVHMKDGIPAGPVEDFATGFADLASDKVLGRPVGLAVGPDGALYVSDDKGGFIYRISYSP